MQETKRDSLYQNLKGVIIHCKVIQYYLVSKTMRDLDRENNVYCTLPGIF